MPPVMMAEQVVDSHELQYERGQVTGTRQYLVRMSDASPINAATILIDAPIPIYLEAWDGSLPTLLVRTRTAQPVAGSEVGEEGAASLWMCTIGYAGPQGGSDPVTPGEPGYVRPEVDIDAQIIDHYRLPTFSYFPTTADQPAIQDIGGLKVDADGQPISGLVRNITLAIGNIYTAEPAALTLSAYVATRNDIAIFGAPVGMLLMLPLKKTRLETGYWQIEWRIQWDAYAHMRQTPLIVAATGEPAWAYTTVGSVDIRQAEVVYWRQPFRLASSHGLTWADLDITV